MQPKGRRAPAGSRGKRARPGLEEQVGRRLAARGWTLAVAESCTGGLVGHRVTSVSGSSAYFIGGVIAYANEVKVRQLGVGRATLRRMGAVSAPVAQQMADGVRRRMGATIGVGVTGVAGPLGGTVRKPVGLVFVGLADGKSRRARRFRFRGDRDRIRRAASEAALRMLKQYLDKEGVQHG